ncbi:MAG: Crp/Fnr family transcriptional regulator [Bacteroidota bacterium]
MSNCEQCIVRQFNALKSLTKEELTRISNCKTSKTISKGQLIFDEGEHINGVYCIREGICKLTKLSANGRDQIVKLVVRGDLMGQRSLVCEEVTNLSATALSEMKVCFIPKYEIMTDLHENPEFTLDILQHMAKDLREADNVIVNMAQKSVKQRLAEALLYIHSAFGTDAAGMLTIVLSREDYANIVGTATESIIRILSQFKKDGLIATKGKQIKLEDMATLRNIE